MENPNKKIIEKSKKLIKRQINLVKENMDLYNEFLSQLEMKFQIEEDVLHLYKDEEELEYVDPFQHPEISESYLTVTFQNEDFRVNLTPALDGEGKKIEISKLSRGILKDYYERVLVFQKRSNVFIFDDYQKGISYAFDEFGIMVSAILGKKNDVFSFAETIHCFENGDDLKAKELRKVKKAISYLNPGTISIIEEEVYNQKNTVNHLKKLKK